MNINEIAQAIDDHARFAKGDRWIVVRNAPMAKLLSRTQAILRGCPVTKHARRRGARGRKRALMAARWWKPVALRVVMDR